MHAEYGASTALDGSAANLAGALPKKLSHVASLHEDILGRVGETKEREEAVELAVVPLIGNGLSNILDFLTIHVIGGTHNGEVLAIVASTLCPNTGVNTLPK